MTYPLPRPTEFAVWGVYDAGVPNKERLVLRANAWFALNHFGICVARVVRLDSGQEQHMPLESPLFWFPVQWAQPLDWIVVYTGSGAQETVKSTDGHPMHLFYWGQKVTMFKAGSQEIAPLVFRIVSFSAMPVHTVQDPQTSLLALLSGGKRPQK
jgi:hypothetical protein